MFDIAPAQIDLSLVVPMKVGGMEGEKFRTYLEGENGAREYLVLKRYKGTEGRKDALESVAGFNRLRETGNYLVPDRSFCVEDGEDTLVAMSDVTDNGRLLLWGYSDQLTPEQQQELDRMQLTPENIKEIEMLAGQVAEHAVQDNLRILREYYHVRMDPETRKLEIVLLDMNSAVYDFKQIFNETTGRELKNEMHTEANDFIQRLEVYSGVLRPEKKAEREAKRIRNEELVGGMFQFD